MRIESIKPSNQNRFTITLDTGEILRAGVDQIADFSLYEGRELDGGELRELRDELALASARSRALRILGTRMMSRSEITRWLVEKGETREVADSTADWLEGQGFINDEEYALSVARHYRQRGYGTARVKSELYRRGVSRDLWDIAINDNDGDVDETDDIVYNYIHTRLRGAIPDKAEKKRVSDALLRRGFSWDEINSAMRRYIEENED